MNATNKELTMIKVHYDRQNQGRTHRQWTFGLGDEAREHERFHWLGTYATARRRAVARAEELGLTVVECYRDGRPEDPAYDHRISAANAYAYSSPAASAEDAMPVSIGRRHADTTDTIPAPVVETDPRDDSGSTVAVHLELLRRAQLALEGVLNCNDIFNDGVPWQVCDAIAAELAKWDVRKRDV